MKVDITTVFKLNLTPNGLYVLLCKKKDIEPKLVNLTQELRILETDGFIDPETGTLTQLAEECLAKASHMAKTSKAKYKLTAEEAEYVAKYREMFPAGKLPGRPPFRASVKELTPRFEWFFANYPQFHDWNLVLQATAMIIEETKNDTMYLPSSENFIYKTEQTKLVKSRLADYCQIIVDGGAQQDQQSDEPRRSFINLPGYYD